MHKDLIRIYTARRIIFNGIATATDILVMKLFCPNLSYKKFKKMTGREFYVHYVVEKKVEQNRSARC